MPSADLSLGDFACIVLRVKDLYAAACLWQQDISSWTQLSLRGVKRRSQISAYPGGNGADNHDEDALSTVGVDKVVELSNSPILLKVGHLS